MTEVAVTLLDGADPLARELAVRHSAEWGHLYADWDSEEALTEFRGQKRDGSLPATLVLRDSGKAAGSVSLIHGDCPARPDLNPWLASLYVFPEFRGRGHGHRLIEAAVRHAASIAVKELHVFTESAGALFRQHGFSALESTSLRGVPVEIMRRELP
jgi:N-acetylglutamate synthase-like GNAT family acetyltransferase